MKSLTTVGILLLAVAALLFYLTTDFSVEKITLSHFMGIMGGVGIGLIIGGVIGYISKGSAVREAAKRKEFERLQKEKIEIERQAAELAAQQNTYNKNTQS
ncbi:hypothetical protein J5295_00285 [Riemerella anatipestifer]|uniref:DUF1049 domain-containing protein n=2 Tax=Riemerella anatipestifer TaxID=34085 RepID=A0AAP6HGZ3_RIEAN|nr:hypothetical protein [Riemerella anatipestifer]ADQ81804.1 hypothetical protein Riean_0640 [Riemerella anatipestifer ATCC 11845 = DSM 15868]ADZ12697.1 hypothetical protein RIA_1611 [Riemerella anatipestifer RA-GD]AFD55815.1 hypothetical protein RA0C_0876 [Riemerella anatipestifer ATCC 11845 = DSM 15868]AGC40283.1 hypothetical protein G148_0979 [Riemerella anatipestifer RA-CH-2]AKP69044.1 hypothetical protein CG08_0716 [Riemerella anatipestifer]